MEFYRHFGAVGMLDLTGTSVLWHGVLPTLRCCGHESMQFYRHFGAVGMLDLTDTSVRGMEYYRHFGAVAMRACSYRHLGAEGMHR